MLIHFPLYILNFDIFVLSYAVSNNNCFTFIVHTYFIIEKENDFLQENIALYIFIFSVYNNLIQGMIDTYSLKHMD